jgi:hypothetical protein
MLVELRSNIIFLPASAPAVGRIVFLVTQLSLHLLRGAWYLGGENLPLS